MAVKTAYRKLIRDTNPPYKLRLAFIDSATGQVLTDLTGYTILDQGTNVDVPAPGGNGNPTPDNPVPTGGGGGGGSGAGGFTQEPFDYAEWAKTHSQGSGNIFEDFGIMFDRTKRTIDNFTDAIKEQIIPGSTGRVNKETGLTDIPPIGGGAAVPRDPSTIRDPLGEPFVSEDHPKSNVSTVQRTSTGSTDKNLNQAKSEQSAARGSRSLPSDKAVLSSLGGDRNLDAANKSDLITTTPSLNTDPKVPYVDGRNISYNPDDISVRKQPIQPEIRDAIAAAIKATNPKITMEINSGGQEPINSPNANDDLSSGKANRMPGGTINHDVVGGKSYAVDGKFFLDGKQITPASNPEIFREIAKNAVIAGATQIGMEGGVVHIGKDPKDDHVRTWGYPGGLPEAIAQGVKDGQAVLASDPEATNKLLGTIAPIPATRDSGAMVRANAARTAFGLPAVAVAGLSNAVTGALNGVGKALSTPDLGTAFSQSVPFFGTVGDALVDAGNAALKGKKSMSGDAIRDQIKPLVPEVYGSIRAGIESAIASVGQGLGDINQGVGTAVAGLMNKLPAPSMLGGQSPIQTAQTPGTDSNLNIAKSEQKGLMQKGVGAVGGTGNASVGASPVNSVVNDPIKMDTIVKTILGEAVGEGSEGMLAVANVIKNRAASGNSLWPDDPFEVVAQGNGSQFNAFGTIGKGGIADKYPPGTPQYDEAKRIAEAVFNGTAPDPTNGSVFYYNPREADPNWADKMGAPLSIGNHDFFPTRPESIMSRPETRSATTPTGSSITPSQRNAIAGNQSTLRSGASAVGGGSSSGSGTGSVATTPTGSSITAAQRNAIADTSGVMSRPSSSSSGTGSVEANGSVRSGQATTPTGSSITAAQRNAIASTSGSDSTTIGSSGRSSSETERTSSAARSGSSAVGGVMSSPTSTAPRSTSSSSPSPISSGASAVGSAGGRTTSSSQTVTTSSGGTITKAQSDAIRRL